MSFFSNGGKQFHRSESVPSTTQRIIEMLDHIEHRTELFREHATAMECEKSALLDLLSFIDSHKDLNVASEAELEEIKLTSERLRTRISAVDISVSTPRSDIQLKALDTVNVYIDALMNSNYESAKLTLEQYLSACNSEIQGNIHQKFQSALLECTVDDQKKVRRKLETLKSELPNILGNEGCN